MQVDHFVSFEKLVSVIDFVPIKHVNHLLLPVRVAEHASKDVQLVARVPKHVVTSPARQLLNLALNFIVIQIDQFGGPMNLETRLE